MHVTLLVAGLVGLTLATPQRNGKGKAKHPIEEVLDQLNGGIQKTQRDVKAWRGDAAGADLVLSDAQYLLGDLRKGAEITQSAPQANIYDGWLEPAFRLDRNLEGLAEALIAQKTRVIAVRKEAEVLGALNQIMPAVDTLVKVIFTKLPSIAQPLARPISNQIVGRLEKVQKAYDTRGPKGFGFGNKGSKGSGPGNFGSGPGNFGSGPGNFGSGPGNPGANQPAPASPWNAPPPPSAYQSGPQAPPPSANQPPSAFQPASSPAPAWSPAPAPGISDRPSPWAAAQAGPAPAPAWGSKPRSRRGG